MTAVINSDVQHPKLYQSNQGFLHIIKEKDAQIRLCLMEYIDGKNLYQLKSYPSESEIRFLAQQVAVINKIKLIPSPRYYSWAVGNFIKGYRRKKRYLTKRDNLLISRLVGQVKLAPRFKKFPHCFIHSDIIRANVMKSKRGKLFIIDFAVADFYPRIQELAVILSDLLFKENQSGEPQKSYQAFLAEYQRYTPLTKLEIKYLPLFTQCAHAINIINPSYYKVVDKNYSSENEYWINRGRAGLELSLDNFL